MGFSLRGRYPAAGFAFTFPKASTRARYFVQKGDPISVGENIHSHFDWPTGGFDNPLSERPSGLYIIFSKITYRIFLFDSPWEVIAACCQI